MTRRTIPYQNMKLTRLSMSCRVWFFTLFMLCICHVTRGGFERYCGSERRHYRPRGVCGDKLSRLVANVCAIYNKRGIADDHMVSPLREVGVEREKRSVEAEVPFDDEIFLSRPEAFSILKRGSMGGHPRDHGITCECCVNRCNFKELMDYCRVPNPNLAMRKRGMSSYQRLSHKDRTKENLDNMEKARIGQMILHRGPSYWENMARHMTTDTDTGYHSHASHKGSRHND